MNRKYLLPALAALALTATACGNSDDNNNSSGAAPAAQRQMFCVSPNANNEPVQMTFSQDNSQVTVKLADNSSNTGGTTPSPTPSASPSPRASATPMASPTPTASPTMASTPDSITDLAAGVSLTFVRLDQTSSSTGGTATPTPTPSVTASPSPTPSVSATPSASPTPVASATPTPAAQVVTFLLQGIPAAGASSMTTIHMEQALANGTGNGQMMMGGATYNCSSDASVLNGTGAGSTTGGTSGH